MHSNRDSAQPKMKESVVPKVGVCHQCHSDPGLPGCLPGGTVGTTISSEDHHRQVLASLCLPSILGAADQLCNCAPITPLSLILLHPRASHCCRCFTLILFIGSHTARWGFLAAQTVNNPSAVQETHVQSLGREDPLEEGMATHSSVLAWRIPRT